MNKKIENFKEWLYLKYNVSKEYGNVEEWNIWEIVIDKFNEVFDES